MLGRTHHAVRASLRRCPSGCCRGPSSRHPTPTDEDAFVELARIAARAHGVGERAVPARLLPAAAGRRQAGDRHPGRQRGAAPGRRSRAGGRPATSTATPALPRAGSRPAPCSSPFDPLVWERARVEALFGFRYRIEIYVPADKRVHGYYVLPFLLGDRLVARVDLKSDRQAAWRGALLVRSAWAEAQAPPETAAELLAELRAWPAGSGSPTCGSSPAATSRPPCAGLRPKPGRRVGARRGLCRRRPSTTISTTRHPTDGPKAANGLPISVVTGGNRSARLSHDKGEETSVAGCRTAPCTAAVRSAQDCE